MCRVDPSLRTSRILAPGYWSGKPLRRACIMASAMGERYCGSWASTLPRRAAFSALVADQVCGGRSSSKWGACLEANTATLRVAPAVLTAPFQARLGEA